MIQYFTNFYGQTIPYEIGANYIYQKDGEVFKLLKVGNHIFYFDKNQWCTDLVFMDLIEEKTGAQVCKKVTEQTYLRF